MNLDPQRYLNIFRDPRGYRDLKRELRKQSEDERFHFIWAMLEERRGLALRLANACLRRRDLFDRLLVEAIRTSDASSMRTWLKCIVPRLGAVRVLRAVQRDMDAYPNVTDSVLWHMPGLMLKCSRREAYARKKLYQAAWEKGYIRAPAIIQGLNGRVKFKAIE